MNPETKGGIMPDFSTVVLTDRQGTPVAHNFQPASEKDGVFSYRETDGSPVGDKKLTVSLRPTGSRHKVKMVLTVPIVQDETINGISRPVVVRNAYGEINLNFDDSSSLQERSDLVGMLASALSAASTLDAVATGLENLY
jgi:hypothetical protein